MFFEDQNYSWLPFDKSTVSVAEGLKTGSPTALRANVQSTNGSFSASAAPTLPGKTPQKLADNVHETTPW